MDIDCQSGGNAFEAAEIVVPYANLFFFEDRLGGLAEASSSFEVGAAPDPTVPAVEWSLQLLFAGTADRAGIEHAISAAARDAGIAVPPVRWRQLQDRDWVSHTNRLLQPFRAGAFIFHGAHDAANMPHNRHVLQVDAGQAFGTGRAPSTFGCVLAIEHLAKRRHLGKVLDLGCGSGILAMVAGRLGGRVWAADIDPVAVRVTRANARRNRVALHTVQANGLTGRKLTGQEYDLVVANILSRPLQRMAAAIARQVAPGGRVILSGLLAREERAVRARYRAAGLVFAGRVAREGWHTLILNRRTTSRA
jgi:ribosomal protein L11 methyltransferase